jgi:hypothetical protein
MGNIRKIIVSVVIEIGQIPLRPASDVEFETLGGPVKSSPGKTSRSEGEKILEAQLDTRGSVAVKGTNPYGEQRNGGRSVDLRIRC